jgi:NADH dehydrogenase/NADH:ubiquinone oxidoreductase subunit G
VTILIDNKPCDCEAGEYIIDVAARNGIVIPTLCHHDGLPGQGCCRVCLVEVETDSRRDTVTACLYPVKQGNSIHTNSNDLTRRRGMVLSLLRSMAPESDKIAQLCKEYNAPEHSRFVRKNGEKCILCGLCVKACESLGTGAIATVNRGATKAVTTPYNEPSFVCVGCASCSVVCPTGAITVSETGGKRHIWNKELPLKVCKSCGTKMGTFMELWRSAEKTNTEVPDYCEACRKKAITDVMAATYGS